MNAIDLFILIVLAIGLVKGLFDGIIKQAVSLIAIVLATYGCALLAIPIESWIAPAFGLSQGVAHTFGLIIGFLTILIIIPIAGKVVTGLVKMSPIGILNHVAGGIAGIAIAGILMSYLFLINDGIFTRNQEEDMTSLRSSSALYDRVKNIVPTFAPHRLFTQ
ncbi:CvpA family protein [Porphyromonas loveana]|uniref:CvpA family protein n=1 Tax=Porphyromonas loveana TaxID=1884669 RepID=UPI0035A05594